MSIKAIFYSKFDTQEGPKVIHQVPEGSIVSSPDSNDGPPFFSFPSISSFIIPRQSLCGNLISIVPPPQQSTSSHPSSQPPSSPSYRILGHPICLTSSAYPRNEFIFNFCLVLSATAPDFNAYKSVVTKLAHLMLSLEEQSHFLSRDTSAPNTGKLYSLCETLISDLNNYCECMIPIDSLNTLNLKLFPTYAPPPPVKAWHVPIFTVRPESLMDENWDLTMQRIVPHVNGVSSVKHISILADADLGLTKQCIKHLLYYGCLLLLDIFSFTAIYAPTAEFASTIASDEDMQRECARYVNTAFAPISTADKLDHVAINNQNQPDMPLVPMTGGDIWPLDSSGKPVDGVGIVELFAALKQGQSVREWYAANSGMLASIDLRRFVTFGVIKGFVYRVHKYAFAANHGTAVGGRSNGGGRVRNGKDRGERQRDRERGKGIRVPTPNTAHLNQPAKTRERTTIPVRSMGNEIHITHHNHNSAKNAEEIDDDNDTATIMTNNAHNNSHRHQQRRQRRRSGTASSSPSASDADTQSHPTAKRSADSKVFRNRLSRYLDGSHCFDQICTDLEISEVELEAALRRWGSGADNAASHGVGGGGKVVIIHR